jgi:hypothetical protein
MRFRAVIIEACYFDRCWNILCLCYLRVWLHLNFIRGDLGVQQWLTVAFGCAFTFAYHLILNSV